MISAYATGLAARADAGRRPQHPADRGLRAAYVDEVPTAVALSEAVSLARELSTDESPAFVNGVLAKIASQPATTD